LKSWSGSIGRRTVHLHSLDDLASEAERIVAAAETGRARTVGNWSPAQILQHVGRLIEFSLDGFPFRYGWRQALPARLLGMISWRWLLALAFRPGFKNPPRAQALEPDPTVTLTAAADYLRSQLVRIKRGERMRATSPTGERPSHDQWVEVHLRHAALHFGFVSIADAPFAGHRPLQRVA
jgi:hypothetical protein